MRWLFVIALAGCPSTPPPSCITVDVNCGPSYLPTSFDDVWTRTIMPSCGTDKSACHSATGHMDGLDMHDEPTAYSNLMMKSGKDPSRLRVVPGDPACSLFIVRTDSPGADYQMPVGDPLSPQESCALIKWVAMGAPGPGSGSAQ